MGKELSQYDLFGLPADEVVDVDPLRYDKILLMFSGGKDSLALLCHLLELGVPKDRIELWHHEIDGRGEAFMDWPITPAYCQAIADAFGIKLYNSWRVGGFLKEMLRDNEATEGVITETPNGDQLMPAKGNKLNTRLKFPQVGADLQTRWCSGYLKIDVASRAITGQDRFKSGKFLVMTGERAEESSNRAKYKVFEPHKATTRDRRVDQWRAVLKWSEAQVWAIIERFRIRPHPSYLIGLSRVSCLCCIFASPNQWATVAVIAPSQFGKVSHFEQKFGVTIRRDGSVSQAAAKGKPLQAPPELIALAMGVHYTLNPILAEGEVWELPRGAFGEACGPT